MNNKPNEQLELRTVHGTWMDAEHQPGLVSVVIPAFNRAHFLSCYSVFG